jgi:phage tail sheath protein FI
MMAVPGITMPEVVVELVAHCERLKSRFAVLDMPKDLIKPKDLIEYRNLIDSTYAAMYHPWIQMFDRSSNKAGFIPPSGAIMGVYSRTDIERGVHKAPANETVACTGLMVNYTQSEQDILNPEGINLIRSFPGQGIRVWGARTASSNSAFKYVNVRRLFIFVEESIKANTNWVVFEPNDQMLWQRVALTVSSFLDGLWRNGMLAGSTASESYFVEIGTSTMTRDDIMNGRLICNIGIAPSRPAEFVIFRVTQHTAESGGGGEEG